MTLSKMTTNIGGDKNDTSFRYKRPIILTKIEGSGNGIKTIIRNISDIAKALHIDVRYPTKYFGIELGANSDYDKKRNITIITGTHQTKDLESILEKFVSSYILCPVCKLPELRYKVKKSIKLSCDACGHSSTLLTGHRLDHYILKTFKDCRVKKPKKVQIVQETEEEEVVWFTDSSDEACLQRMKEEFGDI